MANTFTKLIRCECNHNYRFIKERDKNKYLCSGYSKKLSNCERNILDEKLLLTIVKIYCNRNKIELIESNEFMKSIIEKINIGKNHNITIIYKNGENGIYNDNSIHI